VRRGRSIIHPIASDTWTYRDSSGRKRKARIAVAKPRPVPRDPYGDWYCAVRISGWRRNPIPVFGIGPLDSLANGLKLVQAFQEEIGTANIIVQAGKRYHSEGNPTKVKMGRRRTGPTLRAES
jgi:hypothetical protein